MAKGSGGIRRGSGFQGRITGGRVRVGSIGVGDRLFRPGDAVGGRGGFEVSRVNSATFGVNTSSGAGGRISRRDLVGGFVQRAGSNTFTRIGR